MPDQGVHCLPFHLHPLTDSAVSKRTVPLLGRLQWLLWGEGGGCGCGGRGGPRFSKFHFMVSQILEFLWHLLLCRTPAEARRGDKS